MKKKTKKIVFWFRKQDKNTSKICLNRCVERMQGSPWIHSELYFVDDQTTVKVTSLAGMSIVKTNGSEYGARKIWDGYVVDVDATTYKKFLLSCKKKKGMPFNMCGFLTFFLFPCLAREDEPALICSRHMALESINYGILDPLTNGIFFTPAILRKEIRKMSNNNNARFTIKKILEWKICSID